MTTNIATKRHVFGFYIIIAKMLNSAEDELKKKKIHFFSFSFFYKLQTNYFVFLNDSHEVVWISTVEVIYEKQITV